MPLEEDFMDMDMVLTKDGFWRRVLGNWPRTRIGAEFPTYALYSPSLTGDRTFRGRKYIKRRTPTSAEIVDVLHTFKFFRSVEILEHIKAKTIPQPDLPWADTEWGRLYAYLRALAPGRVGVLGSCLIGNGIHCQSDVIRNDVDFFIEGLDSLGVVQEGIKALQLTIRAQPYGQASLDKLFRHWDGCNSKMRESLPLIISRRWGGFELLIGKRAVENTLRVRDPAQRTSLDLFRSIPQGYPIVEIRGRADDTEMTNLFPRQFNLRSPARTFRVVCMWWQLPSFVRDGDEVTVCGELMDPGGQVPTVRISNYREHWISIAEPS
jgi:hypothetical protein